jgi:D-glycero-D-manno-heptose 1,7-bisphosphate phosphatase
VGLPLPSVVLLDRDGTINVKAPEGQYVCAPNRVFLIPGAARAVRRINALGLPTYVVTNQRGVARGVCTEAQVAQTNRRISELLEVEDAFVDGYYVCSHEKDMCDCRKPLLGLAHRLAEDVPELDLGNACVIGDAETDVLFGMGLGAYTVRLGASSAVTRADVTCSSLLDAVDFLVDAWT